MATIPIFAPTADYQVGGLQGFTAPTAEPMKDATGAQIAQRGDALGKIGTTAIVMASRMELEAQRTQDVADEAETARADAQLAQVVVQDMYGKDGYMGLTGLNATVDRWGQVSGGMHEKQEKIREGLSTEGSRKLFDRHALAKWPALDAEGLRHAGVQSRAAHLSESLNRSKQEANLALEGVGRWNEQDSPYEGQVLTALAVAEQALAANGVPRAEIATEIMKMKTAITSAAVHKLLASGTTEGSTQAELYYQAHKEGIDQSVAGGLEKLVHDTVKIAEADQAGYNAFKETQAWASSPEHRGATLKDQIDHLDNRLDKREITIGVHDLAVRRVKDAAAAVEAAVAKVEHDNLKAGYAWLDGGGTVDSMKPGLRASLPPGQLVHLRVYEENMKKDATDITQFYHLAEMAMNDPEAFRELDLLKFKHLVSNENFQKLLGWKMSITKADPGMKAVQETFKSVMSVVGDTLRGEGFQHGATPGSAAAKKFAAFETAASVLLDDMQKAGIPLPKGREALRKFGMDLLRETSVGEGHWWTGGRDDVYEAVSKSQAEGFTIPVKDRFAVMEFITENYRDYAFRPTEEKREIQLRVYRSMALKPAAQRSKQKPSSLVYPLDEGLPPVNLPQVRP